MRLNRVKTELRDYVRDFIANVIRIYTSIIYHDKRNAICFMPHQGMLSNDLYDIFNYQSDNALSFANYLLKNNLEQGAPFFFIVSDWKSSQRLTILLKEKYPNREFGFVPYFEKLDGIKDIITYSRVINRSKYIFTSFSFNLKGFRNKHQKIVDLNYFTVPFKNDIFSPSHSFYMKMDKLGTEYDAYVCPSELSIRLIIPTMTLPYSKYVLLGMCRNDHLLADCCDKELRERLVSKLDYRVDKILLYTPTHRDYEKQSNDISRFLLGFSANMLTLDTFLKANNILILCKLHPKQNKEIISKELPTSIMIHQPNHDYGLTELMRISDGLITDYTSGYFDYLLLDKPVIFNFYDVDKYKTLRGFTYDPIESITAGEIIKDEESFKNAILNIDANKEIYAEKRHFVRDLFFTHQDTKNCERVYNYFFVGKQ